MSKLDSYRQAAAALPSKYKAWQVFGAGLENVGKDGKPVDAPLREPADNEILLRVDALGLCLSDIKIINQGGAHPRLRGRDLAVDPTVLGHECAATVVKVGRNWEKRFKPGERYIVQADIYYNGVGYAFGYMIPGGLAEYCYLDERALNGDEGCYLLPVKPETGYSQSALSEPWACVEMSYNLDDRLTPGSAPIVVADSPGAMTLRDARHVAPDLENLPEGDFADVIVVSPTPEIVNSLAPRLKKGGAMFLVGDPAQTGKVTLDIGRIHYEDIRFYGGADTLEGLARAHKRNDLLPGGKALFVGAGGPMGQMHVQRAVEIENGSSVVVVTDLDRERLDHIERRFGAMAAERGRVLHTLAPSQFNSQTEMDDAIRKIAPEGYNDVCILAPVPKLVTAHMRFAADHALMNVFAGIPIGNPADLELEDLCRGVRIIGSSGSRISDLRKILQMVEDHQLNTNLSVAAIGGLSAARDGLEAVKTARFPGKTVIYPQIPVLPLMSIEEIPEQLPQIADKLGADGAWTKEAEEALLEIYA